MEEFYFCSRTELSIHKGDSTVHPKEMKRLKVRDLLEHRIRAFGHSVEVERVGKDRARFVFKGVDHGKTYGHDDPAEDLLRGIVHLGTYYDRQTNRLYF